MARRSKSKGSVVSLNMKGVEGRVLVDEGDYHAEVREVTQEEGDKAPYFAWVFEITEGKFKGKPLYYNTSLAPQALWNLKGLLEALGVEIPDDEFDLDLKDMEGLEIVLTVEHDKYEGKKRAQVVDFSSAEGGEPEKDDKKAGKGKKDKSEPEIEWDDIDDSDVKKLGRELKIKTRDPDEIREELKDGDLDDVRAAAKELDIELPGDEEEPEEKEEKSSKDKKGKKDKLEAGAVDDMSQEELEELIKEHDLDVDLDKYKTLRKMRAAVVDELEEKDLIEE